MDPVTLGMAKADAKKKFAGKGSPKPNMLAALFGDSITARHGATNVPNTGETSLYNDARGWFHWANMLLGRPFRIIKNAGVGGDTTTQMLARITDITALPTIPGWVFGMGGVNDQSALAPATTISNLKKIFDALFAAGVGRIVWGTITPDNGNTGQRWVTDQVNDWLKAYAFETPNFTLVNWAEIMLDPSNGNNRTGFTSDGLHPSALGAAMMGQYLADVLRPLVPRTSRLLMSNSTTQVSANSMLTGSVAGLATGYNQTGFTAYKMPRYDGRAGEWQMLVSGAAGGSTMFQNIGVGATFQPGDTVFSELEFETDDDWSVCNDFGLVLQAVGDSTVDTTVNTVRDFFRVSGLAAFGVNPRRGILRTPRLVVPAGVVAGSAGKLVATFRFDGVGSIRVGRFSTLKVVNP